MTELRAVVGPNPGAGHGECFIWSQRGAVVAVDAGGARSVGKHAGASRPEVLILSHDDRDHIGGAVALIEASKGALRELWMPAEWAILIDQISRTTNADPAETDAETVDVESVGHDLANQLVDLAGDANATPLASSTLISAELNLSSWSANRSGPGAGFRMRLSSSHRSHWYGAKDLGEIIKRVLRRAKPLLRILRAAQTNNIKMRFFSIDLALADHSTRRSWETADAGRPGAVTLANALEAPQAVAVRIPPGLPYSYALTRLTVQNRRALCTLLWSEPKTSKGGVLIWSDTDGDWLKSHEGRGFTQVTSSLAACSAPHHASANPAHDSVWTALRGAPNELVVISAGGQHNQTVRAEYHDLSANRCCTWCRGRSTTYQEVRASMTSGGSMSLLQSCLSAH